MKIRLCKMEDKQIVPGRTNDAIKMVFGYRIHLSRLATTMQPGKRILTRSLLSTVLTTISSGVYCDTSNLSFSILLSPSSWMSGLLSPSSQVLESFLGLSELLLWLVCCCDVVELQLQST